MSALTLSLFEIFILLPILLVTYIVSRVFYNIFLHPLRSYPGPLSTRSTILPAQQQTLDGRLHMWLHELHMQYGPVVRYSPDELSFIEPGAWKDIYGHKTTSLFQKDYKLYGPDSFGSPPGLMRADDISHARQRKLVSHAFSDKALHEQQALLMHYVKLLVQKLKEATKADAQSKVDMVDWYNFTTFDIMADLTFGEPLKLLEDSAYTPWVRSIFANMKLIQIGGCIRHWPGLEKLMFLLLAKKRVEGRKVHIQHSITRVDKRMALKTDRPDIWTYVLRYSESEEKGKGLEQTEMHSNAGLFMVAGTETTATELSAITYYLLKNPQRMERLKEEVRNAFNDPGEMTMTALGQLSYLGACIEEGLRVFPPVPGALPRVAPKEGAMVRGQWLPGGTTVKLPMYAAYHSPSNFKNPDAFIPERWLPEGREEYASDNKEVLNPFSTGPRNCLGKNLAYHEMRLMLANIIWNFDLELCEESENWLDQKVYMLWEKGPLMVTLTSVRD